MCHKYVSLFFNKTQDGQQIEVKNYVDRSAPKSPRKLSHVCSVGLPGWPVNGHLFIEKHQFLSLSGCLEPRFHLGLQDSWLDYEPWEIED